MAWAEDRAPWRHNPSADPGTKTKGVARCRPVLPFGIGTNAVNRAIGVSVQYPSPFDPGFSISR